MARVTIECHVRDRDTLSLSGVLLLFPSHLLHIRGLHGFGPLDAEEGHHIDLCGNGSRVEELVGAVLGRDNG